MRTRIKICGIRSLEIARLVCEAGADALGFIFHPVSPRYIDPLAAGVISRELPVWINRTGVFVHQTPQEILQIVQAAGLDTIQLHGDQDQAFVQDLRQLTALPLILVRRVSGLNDSTLSDLEVQGVNTYLLDRWDPGEFGGTGQTLDFSTPLSHKQQQFLSDSVILAGGIHPGNALEILKRYRPYGLDLSSGLEKEKGVKDPQKIQDFFTALAAL